MKALFLKSVQTIDLPVRFLLFQILVVAITTLVIII